MEHHPSLDPRRYRLLPTNQENHPSHRFQQEHHLRKFFFPNKLGKRVKRHISTIMNGNRAFHQKKHRITIKNLNGSS